MDPLAATLRAEADALNAHAARLTALADELRDVPGTTWFGPATDPLATRCRTAAARLHEAASRLPPPPTTRDVDS